MCFSLKIMHYSNYPAKTQGGTNTTVPPTQTPGVARAPLSLTFRPPGSTGISECYQIKLLNLSSLFTEHLEDFP